jgi:hypothetical protein
MWETTTGATAGPRSTVQHMQQRELQHLCSVILSMRMQQVAGPSPDRPQWAQDASLDIFFAHNPDLDQAATVDALQYLAFPSPEDWNREHEWMRTLPE